MAEWTRRFGEEGPDRGRLAKRHGVTPGRISHMLLGTKPISVVWKYRFAEYMGMKTPAEIWPDFPRMDELLSEMPPHLAKLVYAAARLPADHVEALLRIMQRDHSGDPPAKT